MLSSPLQSLTFSWP